MNKKSSNSEANSFITIEGARVHNLKNFSVSIPRNTLTVITGLSGSGKSSLAFDTLYAEGQRRFVESLSSYARQFLGKLDKPDVDAIRGISPAIAIEQKVISGNPRSTLGTVTELSSYMQLLFARIGVTFSPISGKEVRRHKVEDVVDFVASKAVGTKFLLLSPISLPKGRAVNEHLDTLLRQGFVRAFADNEVVTISDLLQKNLKSLAKVYLVIDRMTVSDADDFRPSLADSVETGFFEGGGDIQVLFPESGERAVFSNRFEADGMVFEEPTHHFFSSNNPLGACKHCGGYGMVIGIDEDLVIPDKRLSVFDNAIACWRGNQLSEWRDAIIRKAHLFNFPLHCPIEELSPDDYHLLWTGNTHFDGINAFFKFVEQQTYKIQYRVLLSRYRGKTKCGECLGTRLRKDASYVKIGGASISELTAMPIIDLSYFFENVKLTPFHLDLSRRILKEIKSRLAFLNAVGLGYLTLDRQTMTLSGGESQRVNLATSLGSSLVGSMYILDEPSIGLHPRDTARLIEVLLSLKKLGNTVIVVEHDEEIMRAADFLIDMGPAAGSAGGEVVFQGDPSTLCSAANSLTADYLCGRETIQRVSAIRSWKDRIIVKEARQNNLKGITVEFPLRAMTAVSGVSGSGKSTLVKDILYPALCHHLGIVSTKPGKFAGLSGDLATIKQVEFVDQNPIGKSSRSNPVTYMKAFDDIRHLYSITPAAKAKGYLPGHFSFNVAGGRCDNCEGEGVINVEMQFMADVSYTCEVCKGKRFKDEVLQILLQGKSISDVLEMTVDEAIVFFLEMNDTPHVNRVLEKLQSLQSVGMGYVTLGQSSNSLSGGEAQRVKLASYLISSSSGHTVFIFDEPTTGLHFHDVRKLLKALDLLVSKGNTVILVEHHPDVIRNVDWVIDLGPESGAGGGELIFSGMPDDMGNELKSITGRYLAAIK